MKETVNEMERGEVRRKRGREVCGEDLKGKRDRGRRGIQGSVGKTGKKSMETWQRTAHKENKRIAE